MIYRKVVIYAEDGTISAEFTVHERDTQACIEFLMLRFAVPESDVP
jgi:hypothetical protein